MILITMVTDGKKEEHRMDKVDVAKEFAVEKMKDANLYGSSFVAKIYREGSPKQLISVVTNEQ
jgi:hypothetical protein